MFFIQLDDIWMKLDQSRVCQQCEMYLQSMLKHHVKHFDAGGWMEAGLFRAFCDITKSLIFIHKYSLVTNIAEGMFAEGLGLHS
jgi:hypothetical protein